jgi:2-methylisocitrate lyase-like PEP mutase family enzyme
VAVEGFNAAIDRAGAYLEAGADVLFIEAPQTEEQLTEITREFGSKVPLLVNMVEGGATPISGAEHLEDLGFSIVIFPGGIVRALAHTAKAYYGSLYKSGSNKPFADRMFDFNGLNEVLGTNDTLATGAKYDPKSD